MYFQPSLCSVTFRALSPEAVVGLAVRAGIAAIEWGGDVHVPVGQTTTARHVAQLCADNGVANSSYGSYLFRDGFAGDAPRRQTLETAAALGAPLIRVWAGPKGSAESSPDETRSAVQVLHTLSAEAAALGMSVALEYHRHTLTDTAAAARRLLDMVDHPNLYTYWQPVPGRDAVALQLEQDLLGRDLAHLHVFHWLPGDERRPLVEGQAQWKGWLERLARPVRWDKPRYAMIEFVAGDRVEQFLEDAAVLKHCCAGAVNRD